MRGLHVIMRSPKPTLSLYFDDYGVPNLSVILLDDDIPYLFAGEPQQEAARGSRKIG